MPLITIIWCSCTVGPVTTLKPTGYPQASTFAISAGDLKAMFVDNSAFGATHMAGYNGLASLSHASEDSSIFVARYAGFNLEHVFGGDSLVQLFEPRKHPMSLFKKSEASVFLYQDATPLSKVESLTEFTLVPPHYIDVVFQCRFHDVEFFRNGYAGLFWASYIESPDDKRIYFLGTRKLGDEASWVEAYSDEHGVSSTHLSSADRHELFFAQNFNARLANHYSGYHFTEPFYFGLYNKMAFAYLFEPGALIRFSQSPTGGGDRNPAWDFQFIIPDPEPGKVYSFRTRLVYKPFISRDDIRGEFGEWKRSNF